jgi:hypothetical protein
MERRANGPLFDELRLLCRPSHHLLRRRPSLLPTVRHSPSAHPGARRSRGTDTRGARRRLRSPSGAPSSMWAWTRLLAGQARWTDPPLPAPDQRESRAVQPHPDRGMGLRPALPQRDRPPRHLAQLAALLQPSPWTHRDRWPTPPPASPTSQSSTPSAPPTAFRHSTPHHVPQSISSAVRLDPDAAGVTSGDYKLVMVRDRPRSTRTA